MSVNTLIFGSSLVKYLGIFDPLHIYNIGGQSFKFTYKDYPGESFEYFLEKPERLDSVLSASPDVVIVILGGNSISTKVEPEVLYSRAKNFYRLLNEKLLRINPSAKIIASEIPLRFVKNGFKNTPPPEQFKFIRHRVNLKLRDCKYKHYLFRVEGPGRLDCRSNYNRKGIHLSFKGLNKQLDLLLSTLQYMLDNPR